MTLADLGCLPASQMPPQFSMMSSCSSMPRLPSVHEGLELSNFPRLPSVSEGLCDYGADVSPAEAALFSAAANLDAKGVDDLIRGGVDVNFTTHSLKYRSVLHELVLGYVLQLNYFESHKQQHLRFIDTLTLLIHHGVDVNSLDICRRSALHVAASYPGHRDIIKVLLATGVKANLQDNTRQTALHKAVTKATPDDVETLLDGGADPNLLDCAGNSPIHLAAKRKFHPETLTMLLQSGGQTDLREDGPGQRGGTPLHAAVKAGHLDNIRVLLARGASVDLVDSSGQSAVHLAAANDLTGKILECLVRHGANINDQDATYRETPLHKAVKSDMIENFKFLVKKGANPNIRDDQRETVLHKAAACTKPQIWMNLMKLGGKPTIKNRSGLTPLDKAEKAKNHMAVSIMKESCNISS